MDGWMVNDVNTLVNDQFEIIIIKGSAWKCCIYMNQRFLIDISSVDWLISLCDWFRKESGST